MKLLKFKRVIFIGLLMLCGMAFAKDPVYKIEDQNITVTKGNPNFTVKLKYSMGTGFAWDEKVEYDSNLFTVNRLDDEDKGSKLGRPTFAVWKIIANPEVFDHSSQTVKIHFKKTGPGDAEEIGKDFHVTIRTNVTEVKIKSRLIW